MLLSVLLLVYVGLAIVGIHVGRNREAKQNWDSDANFRNMFVKNERTTDESP